MDVASPPVAQLRLRGHEPAPARVDLVRRTRKTRLTKTLVVLLGSWVVAPILFFIPPHVPWVLGALVAGGYFAYRQWTGEFEVNSFAGACPRCGAELTIPPGTRIGLPHRINCYSCHHESSLVVDDPPA